MKVSEWYCGSDYFVCNSYSLVVNSCILSYLTSGGSRIIHRVTIKKYVFTFLVIIGVLLGPDLVHKTSYHREELLTKFSDSVKRIFQTTTKLHALPLHWCQLLNLKPWRDFKECVDMSIMLGKYL